MVLFKNKIDVILMSSDTSEILFSDISHKTFTNIVTKWFADYTGIKTGTFYQRKGGKIWFSIILYCVKCQREYKLKGDAKQLKAGQSTNIFVYCKHGNYCDCGHIHSVNEDPVEDQIQDPDEVHDEYDVQEHEDEGQIETRPITPEAPQFSPITPQWKKFLRRFEYND
ncbi:hypothetical protein PVAND_016944 [Polypedilum vanderplanki]|uniref:Uncharacterized protein n=1 Tax=Polypedilum vanderplanki TaxID=319348 RepID=A0A9J6BHN6_POLVA|nr:hypothetical protein PVAND_016944 [Polypedilum vanderplanki]